jgi:hypothetical protein
MDQPTGRSCPKPWKIEQDGSFCIDLFGRNPPEMGISPSEYSKSEKHSVPCANLPQPYATPLMNCITSKQPFRCIPFCSSLRHSTCTAMSSSQQYQALPVEEKLDGDQSSNQPQTRKWSKTRIGLIFSLLLLVSFAIVGATTRTLTRQTPAVKTSIEDPDSEWLREHLTRATGDTYLIGVGKADITGYVDDSRPLL